MKTDEIKVKVKMDTEEAVQEISELTIKVKKLAKYLNRRVYFWLGLSIGVNIINITYFCFYLIYLR